MLFLGIDQHARQMTVSLINLQGDIPARSSGLHTARQDFAILRLTHPVLC